MILEEITLSGFLSYKKRQTIRFNNECIYLVNGSNDADLSDSNGSGKSSLFESTFVNFFGKTGGRGDRLDAYINHDMNEMYLEHIFKVDNVRYKKILSKPKGSSSLNEIYYDSVNKTIEDASWNIIDKKIEEILGLSFITCNSTVYLNESEATKFIDGTSTDRKEILRDLLNIKIFETAAKKSKNQMDSFTRNIELNLRLISDKQEQIENENDYKEELEDTKIKIKKNEKQISELEKKIKDVEKDKKNIEIKIEKQEIIINQINSEKETIEEYETDIESKEEQIKRNINKLEDFKNKLDEEQTKQKELQKNKEDLEERIKVYNVEVKQYDNIEEKLKKLKEENNDNNEQIKDKEKKLATIKSEINQAIKLLEKIDEFGNVCPITESECPVINDSYKDTYKNEKEKFIKKYETTAQTLTNGIEKLEKESEKLESDEDECLNNIGKKDRLNKRKTKCKDELNEIENVKKDFSLLEKEYNTKVKEFANDEIKLKSEISDLEKKIKARNKKVKELESQIDNDLKNELKKVVDVIDEFSEQLDDLKQKSKTDNDRVIFLETELARIEKVKEDINKMVANNIEFNTKKEIFLNLFNAFGKDGIQKVLMKRAIPYLEETSLELLKIFNNGSEKIKVKFDLDPKTASGDFKKAGGLDILVLEEGHEPKDLRMYSGGETVRIVFSILLGLAKLLSKRSGKKQETLIIDEKIAKLDRKGIEQFSEIINTISSWYKNVFIITHIEALKDIFNEKEIVVNKTVDEGSIVTIN